MATLTVTTRGQVTFRKEVLQHLGIKPGEKIELDLLPDGRGLLKATRPSGSISSFAQDSPGRGSRLSHRASSISRCRRIRKAARSPDFWLKGRKDSEVLGFFGTRAPARQRGFDRRAEVDRQ